MLRLADRDRVKLVEFRVALNDPERFFPDFGGPDAFKRTLGEWGDGVYQEALDYYQDRSDAWKESNRGENYADWLDTLYAVTTRELAHEDDWTEIRNTLAAVSIAPDRD